MISSVSFTGFFCLQVTYTNGDTISQHERTYWENIEEVGQRMDTWGQGGLSKGPSIPGDDGQMSRPRLAS